LKGGLLIPLASAAGLGMKQDPCRTNIKNRSLSKLAIEGSGYWYETEEGVRTGEALGPLTSTITPKDYNFLQAILCLGNVYILPPPQILTALPLWSLHHQRKSNQ